MILYTYVNVHVYVFIPPIFLQYKVLRNFYPEKNNFLVHVYTVNIIRMVMSLGSVKCPVCRIGGWRETKVP